MSKHDIEVFNGSAGMDSHLRRNSWQVHVKVHSRAEKVPVVIIVFCFARLHVSFDSQLKKALRDNMLVYPRDLLPTLPFNQQAQIQGNDDTEQIQVLRCSCSVPVPVPLAKL